MRKWLGEWPQVVKFLTLGLAVLMVASAAANLIYGKPLLAVASAVVAGWALSVCMDVWRAEILRDVKGEKRETTGAS